SRSIKIIEKTACQKGRNLAVESVELQIGQELRDSVTCARGFDRIWCQEQDSGATHCSLKRCALIAGPMPTRPGMYCAGYPARTPAIAVLLASQTLWRDFFRIMRS